MQNGVLGISRSLRQIIQPNYYETTQHPNHRSPNLDSHIFLHDDITAGQSFKWTISDATTQFQNEKYGGWHER